MLTISQKHSAHVEVGRPLCRRWRFWVGFTLNLGSEAVLSSVALYFTPLSLIAPMGGLTVCFNALLVRFGLVCGIKEILSLSEWISSFITMAGVTLVTMSGPGSTSNGPLDLTALPSNMAQIGFVCYCAIIVVYVVTWMLVSHLGNMQRPGKAFDFFRWLRPDDASMKASIMSGTTAACCGSFSILFLKVVSTAIPAYIENPSQIGSHSATPVVFSSLAGLLIVAPLQVRQAGMLTLAFAPGAALA